jgi:site-specific recombinase XerD
MRVIKRGPAFLGEGVSKEFAGSLRAADLAESTRRGYAADLGKFRSWIEQGRGTPVPLRRISTADLASYRQHLIRVEKLRAASVNRKVQALKRFFAWAEQKKLIPANPASALRLLRRRNYALLQLMLQTGLRVGEVAQLAVSDCLINDRSGAVRVRAGKRGKEREVPLNASARRALAAYLKTREDCRNGAPLFLSERGNEPISLRTVQATIQQLARRAKITRIPVSAHTNRENDSDENTSDVLMLANPHLLSIAYARVIGGQNGLQHCVNNLECARGNASFRPMPRPGPCK